MKNQQSNIVAIDINAVKSRMLQVRGQQVLLDRDVAALYGVETRIVNQAVKNNPEKFPAGYVAELTAQEVEILRSKILTLDAKPGKGHYSKHGYKVFTERGLYMLATILKSPGRGYKGRTLMVGCEWWGCGDGWFCRRSACGFPRRFLLV